MSIFHSIPLGVVSSSPSWTPQNIVITDIMGGARITWTARADSETEIYVSIDGGEFTLVTTIAPNIGTYDYMHDEGITVVFRLRFKIDQTILNAPTSLASVEITGGVRLTWDDNNTEADHIEIWGNLAGAGYVLIETVLAGVETYDHVTPSGVTNYYKVRAKEGTLPVYSAYSSEVEIVLTPEWVTLLNDGNTVAQYIADDLTTITKDGSNLVSVWADKLGSGRDLLQAYDGSKPVWSSSGITFDGINDVMKVTSFVFNQPEQCYIVFKLLTPEAAYESIWDGNAGNSGRLSIYNGTGICMFAGSDFSPLYATKDLSSFLIVRALYNGAGSKLITNNDAPATGNPGAANMSGFQLGQDGFNGRTNIQVKEVILRKIEDADNGAVLYNYLKNKYSL